MKYLSIIALLVVLASPNPVLSQEQTADQAKTENGKLRDFGKEVERKVEASENDEPSTHEDERDRERDQATADLLVDILFRIFESAATSTPDTTFEPEEYHTFAQYPYAEAGHGLYKLGGAKDFSLQLKANFYREAPDLMGGGMRLRVSPERHLAAEVYTTLLSERLKTRSDRMLLSSFFVSYNLVRENFCAAWIGLGSKLVRGAGANENGLAGNATIEFYPVDPISLHANFSWGPYSEFFTTLNYHLSRYSVYLGYQALVAGSADLHGFLVGSSLYF
jgi:hypothetical protein